MVSRLPETQAGEAWWSKTVVQPQRMQSATVSRAAIRTASASRARSSRHHRPSRMVSEVVQGNTGIETAGERRVEVVVEVDEAGQNEPAASVEHRGVGVAVTKRRCAIQGADPVALPHHRGIRHHARLRTSGEDGAVDENRGHGCYPAPRRTKRPVPAGAKSSAPSVLRS